MACYLNAELGTETVFISKLSSSPEKQTNKQQPPPQNKTKQKERENYNPHLI